MQGPGASLPAAVPDAAGPAELPVELCHISGGLPLLLDLLHTGYLRAQAHGASEKHA